jgi:transposase InsO family protein
LQKAPGGFKHLLVAIDKFSKWIEVRPLTSIRSEQAVAFFTNIIHRFGVPNSIITDNGTQFTGKKFLDFCEDHHILWGQGHRIRFPEDKGLRRPRQPDQPRRFVGPAG